MYLQLSWVLLAASAAWAFPQLDLQNPHQPQFARILTLQNDADTSGTFSYSYETENGIKAEARGTLNNAGVSDTEEQVVTGSFSFVADDGQVYSVTYIADSNGFRAFGDHLPPSPYAAEAKPRQRTVPRAQIASTAAPPRLPSPEQEDLSRWQARSDIRGLTPPPPPLSEDSYQPGLVAVPTGRNPRPRQQDIIF